jgi:hypothetical protein
MAGPSKIGKNELAKLTREQADVLAFADRNREIVELPEGLETGETKRRKRGAPFRVAGLKAFGYLLDLATTISKREHVCLLTLQRRQFLLLRRPTHQCITFGTSISPLDFLFAPKFFMPSFEPFASV